MNKGFACAFKAVSELSHFTLFYLDLLPKTPPKNPSKRLFFMFFWAKMRRFLLFFDENKGLKSDVLSFSGFKMVFFDVF